MDELAKEKYNSISIDVNDAYDAFKNLLILIYDSFLVNGEIVNKNDFDYIQKYFDELKVSMDNLLVVINNMI